jgi:hypothetical protein
MSANPSGICFQRLKDGQRGLDIGHMRSESGQSTLATMGRNADIHINNRSISKVHVSFEIDPDTHVVLLYDRYDVVA